MKQMRWRTLLLILWLTLLFNIERLDLDGGPSINLASSVYVLALATVCLFLLVPLSRRQMYAASVTVLGAYALYKALHVTPIFSGIHKYLTITEVVALLISAGLAWLVNQALFDFEGAVEAISLPEGRPQLLPYEKVQERMRAEMGRARRHQRPISVAMIDLDPSTFEAALHQAVRDAQAAMISRYVQVRLGLFLSKRIRGTDVIAHHTEGGRFLLLAPETPADQTNELLKRLAREVETQMGIRFRYSVADFPNGALTSEELLHKVTEDLKHAPAATDMPADGARLEPTLDEAHSYVALPLTHEHGLDELQHIHRAGDKEAGDGTRSHNGNSSKNGNSLVS
jgi:GGDEF domain-containing protein